MGTQDEVEKGRAIYAGIQKFVAFIMSVHIAEARRLVSAPASCWGSMQGYCQSGHAPNTGHANLPLHRGRHSGASIT